MHLHDETAPDLLRTPSTRHHGGESARPDGSAPRGGAAPSPTASHLLGLQRAAGNAAVQRLADDDPHGIQKATAGGGTPLDAGTRTHMESSLGADFSDVRVHTDGDADRSARSLGANAYTVGSDVVFAQGRYDPASTDGTRTLAHELTHVVQQRSGPVDGEMTDTGVRVSDPSDRFEQAAVASAEQVVAGGPATSDVGGGAGGVQREEMPEEEEPLQTESLQREEMPDEEELPG